MNLKGKSVRIDVPFEGYKPGTFGVNPHIYSEFTIMNLCLGLHRPHLLMSVGAYNALITSHLMTTATFKHVKRNTLLRYGLVGELRHPTSLASAWIFTDAYRPEDQRILTTKGISYFCIVPPEARIPIPPGSILL